MHQCNESCWSVCLASQPAVLCSKNFDIGHYMQIFEPTLFIPAMLIGTIDFYHFIPPSLTMALPGGHKVSKNLLDYLDLHSRSRLYEKSKTSVSIVSEILQLI